MASFIGASVCTTGVVITMRAMETVAMLGIIIIAVMELEMEIITIIIMIPLAVKVMRLYQGTQEDVGYKCTLASVT